MRYWKQSSGILVHIDMMLQICQLHIPQVDRWIEIGLLYTYHIHMIYISYSRKQFDIIRGFVFFLSWCIILLEEATRTWTYLCCSGYVSYCLCPISSNQCGHSPLTSVIKKVFFSCQLLSIFSFLDLFKPWRWLCKKIPVHHQFLKYSVEPVWHQKPCHV